MRSGPGLLLLAAIAQAASAQPGTADDAASEDGANWYRVELIIFANRDPDAALSETWPLLPALSYPESWRHLREGEIQVAADREQKLLLLEDQLPEPGFGLAWDKSIAELLREQRHLDRYRQPSVQLESLIDLDIPLSFTAEPADTREFAGESRRLARQAATDVLFHESWLQPVRDRASSTPLIVDGIPTAGDFPELQGSILLYSGRYLHIETAVWLNTDGSYLDNDWAMPMPPLPLARPEPLQLDPFAVDPAWDWLGEIRLGEPTREDAYLEPIVMSGPVTAETIAEAAVVYEEIPPDEGAGALEDLDETADITPLDPEAPPPLTEEELEAFLAEPQYDFRHAVLVQQKRRMRSGELHYIDHPLLGILVKVSRYEFEPFMLSEPEQTIAGTRR